MNIIVKHEDLTVDSYQYLRHTTDWFQLDDEVVRESLENDLFALTAYDGDKLVGMGRVVGDGAIYFYIQDIIVIPEYQGRGVGSIIMESIEAYLDSVAYNNSFIGLMAAEGVAEFYHRFGYKERPADKPGMSKLFKRM